MRLSLENKLEFAEGGRSALLWELWSKNGIVVSVFFGVWGVSVVDLVTSPLAHDDSACLQHHWTFTQCDHCVDLFLTLAFGSRQPFPWIISLLLAFGQWVMAALTPGHCLVKEQCAQACCSGHRSWSLERRWEDRGRWSNQ